jgi:UDP-N-acetylmuramate dehydrogenase
MRVIVACGAPYNGVLIQKAILSGTLRTIGGLKVLEREPLAPRTRFGIGGPAEFFLTAVAPRALGSAARLCEENGAPYRFLGDGSNLIVSDDGYRGVVLRYLGRRITMRDDLVEVEAGAPLQALVDFTIVQGLEGLHTLERIPGSVGGAIYGNAGAYGHSLHEFVVGVRYLEDGAVKELNNAQCEFAYRESVFKRNKNRCILSCSLRLKAGVGATLQKEAVEIRRIRDEKFPPDMRCAGSIFKNLYLKDLPPEAANLVPAAAVREGKVASAFFLERVGAKGMKRGGIHIADYHANLIYNADWGSAADLCALIAELKRRVRDEFGFEVEEEVQYLGDFPDA